MTKTNIEIRKAMVENSLAQWELAELIGISESTMSRKFRREMSDKEQKLIVSIIKSKDDPIKRASLKQKYIFEYRVLKRDRA